MTKPRMIGSIGCYSASPARLGRKAFEFNGTTLDLVRCAVRLGAKDGDKVMANFGGGFRAMTIKSAPHDNRANGFWAD